MRHYITFTMVLGLSLSAVAADEVQWAAGVIADKPAEGNPYERKGSVRREPDSRTQESMNAGMVSAASMQDAIPTAMFDARSKGQPSAQELHVKATELERKAFMYQQVYQLKQMKKLDPSMKLDLPAEYANLTEDELQKGMFEATVQAQEIRYRLVSVYGGGIAGTGYGGGIAGTGYGGGIAGTGYGGGYMGGMYGVGSMYGIAGGYGQSGWYGQGGMGWPQQYGGGMTGGMAGTLPSLAGCELSNDSQTISCPQGEYVRSRSIVDAARDSELKIENSERDVRVPAEVAPTNAVGGQ